MSRRELAEIYYDAWTSDGISEAHSDVDAICCWLCDESLRTEEDKKRLGSLKALDIIRLAEDISEMVAEGLKGGSYGTD